MAQPTPEELRTSERYVIAGGLEHARLAEFVIEWFFRRRSWLIYAHHAMTLLTLAAIVFMAIARERTFLQCVIDFSLSLLVLIAVVLPLHELLHALAYRLAGARDIRWDSSLRMAAVWVIAHRFVTGTGVFVFVALAPSVVINGALVAGAIVAGRYAVLLLFVLLWHIHGSIGDWSMLNFVWRHRGRGFLTYDDAERRASYFYVESRALQ